jgi:hypothetical protein
MIITELKTDLQRSVGNATLALQELSHLRKDFIKLHALSLYKSINWETKQAVRIILYERFVCVLLQKSKRLLLCMFSRYGERHVMETEQYDPYYRDLPSTLMPARTPFTRPGRHDAGQIFIYVTNKAKRWSVLLDKTRIEGLYEEARQYVPRGISQFWLLEKRYSTHKLRVNNTQSRIRNRAQVEQSDSAAKSDRQDGSSRTLVVLREPEHTFTRQSG